MKLATSAFSLALVMYFPALLHSQAASFDRLQVAPAPIQNTNSIDPKAPVEELEMRADQLRAQKEFADALDFYRAALAKKPENALLYNKRGICELLEQRYRNAGNRRSGAEKRQHGRGSRRNPPALAGVERRRRPQPDPV